MFQFGGRVEDLDFRGRHRTVGEYALHLSEAWRIVANGRVLVAHGDYYIPATDTDLDDFRPDHPNQSRRDELMPQFMAHGEEAHLVESAEIAELGDLRIVFADGCVLETFADLGFVEPPGDEAPDECWRLFEPSRQTAHVVVEAGGLIDFERPYPNP